MIGRDLVAALFLALGLSLASLIGPVAMSASAPGPVDVVVYGGTPSGVIAAVSAARHGAGVVLIEPTDTVGGTMSNGLGATDIGDQRTIGGISAEFFDGIAAWYKGLGVTARWHFQPHVAALVFEHMLSSAGVAVVRDAALEPDGVVTDGSTIVAIQTSAGTFEGTVFIDASYGGDLMAAAGVSYVIGRESMTTYGESAAGVRPSATVMSFSGPVPDYLSSVSAPGPVGSGDDRVQAANFRMCFSTDLATQIPFIEPADYDATLYGVVADYLASFPSPSLSDVLTLYSTVEHMYDVNDHGPMSSALPGLDWGWSDGSAVDRLAIEQMHATYDRGLVWFLLSDPSVPATIRDELAGYGWCATEWTDNAYFPKALYVRESRRMVGNTVMSQADVSASAIGTTAIGIGSYKIDSHLVTRWMDGSQIKVEGSMFLTQTDYPIPYEIMLPPQSEADNLVVSVTVSASHVAWASLRMEPHFMVMGEAAGTAAAMAVAAGQKVQSIPVTDIRAALRQQGTVLPGTPVTLDLTADSNTSAGDATTVTVSAADIFGGPTPDNEGTLHFSTSDPQATVPSDTPISGSDATVAITFRTPGAHQVVVTDLGRPNLRASASITVAPGPTVALTLDAPDSVIAGASVFMAVKPVDAFGNLTSGYGATIHFSTSDPQATVPPDTFVSGSYAIAKFRFRTADTQQIVATDVHDPTVQGTTSITVQAGPTSPFTDIGSSSFYADILWLYDSGITSGCSDERFCPDDPVTRGQMAAFLDRALHLPSTATDYFTDDDGTTFEGNINRLAASGITKGCSPTLFCPTDHVTRGQMAAFLDRAFGLPVTATDSFTDDDGTTFEGNINRLAASGITKGCGPTTYCPTAEVTRGQMAAFLHRVLGS